MSSGSVSGSGFGSGFGFGFRFGFRVRVRVRVGVRVRVRAPHGSLMLGQLRGAADQGPPPRDACQRQHHLPRSPRASSSAAPLPSRAYPLPRVARRAGGGGGGGGGGGVCVCWARWRRRQRAPAPSRGPTGRWPMARPLEPPAGRWRECPYPSSAPPRPGGCHSRAPRCPTPQRTDLQRQPDNLLPRWKGRGCRAARRAARRAA